MVKYDAFKMEWITAGSLYNNMINMIDYKGEMDGKFLIAPGKGLAVQSVTFYTPFFTDADTKEDLASSVTCYRLYSNGSRKYW